MLYIYYTFLNIYNLLIPKCDINNILVIYKEVINKIMFKLNYI